MSRLTAYNKKIGYWVACDDYMQYEAEQNAIHKLGKLEDLMEKYEIEDLVELEIALDQYYHRYDKVETRRVDNNVKN